MKKQLAAWFRKHADRLDPDGAPRRTGWSFTFEENWGIVFNEQDRGCPLYYLGRQDYELAHSQAGAFPPPQDVEWVTIGMRTPDGGVHVLGSAEVKNGTTSRRAETHTNIDIPVPTTRIGPANLRTARVPNWIITLTCEMHSFVTLPGKTYPEAVQAMFGRSGIRG